MCNHRAFAFLISITCLRPRQFIKQKQENRDKTMQKRQANTVFKNMHKKVKKSRCLKLSQLDDHGRGRGVEFGTRIEKQLWVWLCLIVYKLLKILAETWSRMSLNKQTFFSLLLQRSPAWQSPWLAVSYQRKHGNPLVIVFNCFNLSYFCSSSIFPSTFPACN